ncbi:MAG: DUF1684 domain-containing protein [Bacteroidota bacterium]
MNSRRNSTYIAFAVGAAFLGIILYTQLTNRPTGYVTKMEQARAQKDLQLTNDPQSPIPKDEREGFQGLVYFEPLEMYKAPAQLIPSEKSDTLTLMTTKGTDYQVVVSGKLQFPLQGGTYQLVAYSYLEQEQNAYFVPFTDLTTGVSTYGGGRYLDVPIAEELVIDFNTAYHPYCVYNVSFVCPLPPRENDLPLEIRAGEKLPTQ